MPELTDTENSMFTNIVNYKFTLYHLNIDTFLTIFSLEFFFQAKNSWILFAEEYCIIKVFDIKHYLLPNSAALKLFSQK